MPLTGSAAVRLYDDHVEAVHAMVARRVGDAASPAITAEAFDLALSRWSEFDPAHGAERLFLIGAAVHVVRRHRDVERAHLVSCRPRRPVEPGVVDPLVPRTPAHAADADGGTDPLDRDRTVVMGALADLDPVDRDVVLLSLWEGCTHPEIAEALDVELAEVRTRLGHARSELAAAADAAAHRAR